MNSGMARPLLRKTSIFLLTAILLAASIPGTLFGASENQGTTPLLSDSFNTYPSGSAPSGWTINKSGGPVTIESVPAANDKSLKLTKSDTNTGFSAAHKKLSAPQSSGVITYDTWIMTPDVQSAKFLMLWDHTQTKIPFKITLQNDKIMINDTTLIQTFTANKWIHIIAKLNMDTKKVDLTINDIQKGTHKFYDTGATNIGEVLFSIHPGFKGTLYVKNMNVTKPNDTKDPIQDPVIDIKDPKATPTFFGVVPTESFRIADDEWARYKELGIQALRIHLINGKKWEDYASVVKKAKDNGIEVMMLVSYGSYKSTWEWGTANWGGRVMTYKYDDIKKLIGVLDEAVPYFSKLGVTTWEIWNEENGTWYIAANDYAKLLTEIYEKCKYGSTPWDPKATIVFGGIDAVNVGDKNGINFGAKQYVELFYKSAEYKAFKTKYGRSPFDAFGVHPYNTVAVDQNCKLKYNYFQSAVKGVALDVMAANGDSKIPVWITELGSEQKNDNMQAAELRAYMETAYAMPEVQRFHYFQYVYPGENWGLVNWNRTPRKSLFEYRDVIKELSSK
ncbi:MAG: hypothetical protein FWG14_05005 [Peptococcaceae bacterium]|nr:hypothetical protein [Peptococcaceae bacterium]